MSKIQISPVTRADAGEILTLQRAAYVTEAQLYEDPQLPPLTETLDELILHLDGLALKAVAGQRIVGAIRSRQEGVQLNIGRLLVAPDRQGQGIGTALLLAIEAAAPPSVERFALFTGDRSEHNLRLYQRHGYTIDLVPERTEPTGIVRVHLVKHRHSPG